MDSADLTESGSADKLPLVESIFVVTTMQYRLHSQTPRAF
jgi:hypothetical protein